ncbi:MAG TPA: hypothetical protein VGG39_06555 [Polyangiaceae bacterium]|jgi:hypothetical protein
MFALTLRLMGPRDHLSSQLEATRSASRRASLLRKLALCHDPGVIPTIAPYLACEGRVRVAAVDAILHFGEEAREPMLEILGDRRRTELHPGALRVLDGLVRRAAVRGAGVPGTRDPCTEALEDR